MGGMDMQTVWQISRLGLIPKSAVKRCVAQLRPLGLVLAMQDVASKSLLKATLKDLVPQAVDAHCFRWGAEMALALMPLHLLVERYRELGLPLALLRNAVEDLFGTVQVAAAWSAKKHTLRPRRALPPFNLILKVRTQVIWCVVMDIDWNHLRVNGQQRTPEMPLLQSAWLALCSTRLSKSGKGKDTGWGVRPPPWAVT